jgi:hypothetical protein
MDVEHRPHPICGCLLELVLECCCEPGSDLDSSHFSPTFDESCSGLSGSRSYFENRRLCWQRVEQEIEQFVRVARSDPLIKLRDLIKRQPDVVDTVHVPQPTDDPMPLLLSSPIMRRDSAHIDTHWHNPSPSGVAPRTGIVLRVAPGVGPPMFRRRLRCP